MMLKQRNFRVLLNKEFEEDYGTRCCMAELAYQKDGTKFNMKSNKSYQRFIDCAANYLTKLNIRYN